jgi:hypothetical protein
VFVCVCVWRGRSLGGEGNPNRDCVLAAVIRGYLILALEASTKGKFVDPSPCNLVLQVLTLGGFDSKVRLASPSIHIHMYLPDTRPYSKERR